MSLLLAPRAPGIVPLLAEIGGFDVTLSGVGTRGSVVLSPLPADGGARIWGQIDDNDPVDLGPWRDALGDGSQLAAKASTPDAGTFGDYDVFQLVTHQEEHGVVGGDAVITYVFRRRSDKVIVGLPGIVRIDLTAP